MEIGLFSLGDLLPDPATGERQTEEQRHRTVIEAAVLAEDIGFDSVWLGEHHFSDWVLSVPQIVLAAIAERTTRLRLGTAITLLVNHDPVRLAEDFATLDLVSSGRVEMAVGRGIVSKTYELFGQDIDQSRPLFRDKLELMLRIWREESVVWSGDYRPALDGVAIRPRPSQRPHPHIWVGGGTSEASVDLAADLGLPLMLPSIFAKPERFAPMADRYRERFAAAGHDPSWMLVGGCNHCHVAATSQGARAEWEPYYRNYYEFGQQQLSQSKSMFEGARTVAPFDYAAALRGAGVCGSPSEVADRLATIQELLGLDVHLLMFDLGGLPERKLFDTLQLFAEEALPQLAVTSGTPTAAR